MINKEAYEMFKKKMEYGPGICPHCGGVDIDMYDIEPLGDVVFININCSACGGEWTEEFVFNLFKVDGMLWEDAEELEEEYLKEGSVTTNG